MPSVQALRQMGLEGVLVMDVPPGTPADKAGMQVGKVWSCPTLSVAGLLQNGFLRSCLRAR